MKIYFSDVIYLFWHKIVVYSHLILPTQMTLFNRSSKLLQHHMSERTHVPKRPCYMCGNGFTSFLRAASVS